MINWLQQIKPGPSFTAGNMRAILDGRKIQTRRIIDLDPDLYKVWGKTHVKGRGVGVEVEQGGELFVHSYASYQPGKLYYIREPIRANQRGTAAVYQADGCPVMVCGESLDWRNEDGSERQVDRLPGLCMPRRCARRFSLIQDVWVERVQDLSIPDIHSEGIYTVTLQDPTDMVDEYFNKWRSKWISIHSKESWERNPLVFAYEFEVMNREQARDYVKGESDETVI